MNRLMPVSEQLYAKEMGGAVLIPINENGNRMSPIEASTGVVLPILASTRGHKQNRHHAHFFKVDYESGTDGQKAVRASRLQRVSIPAHRKYHTEYEGTLFPETEEDEFHTTILNAAGYIPSYGVRVAGNKMRIEKIKRKEFHFLRNPTMFTYDSYAENRINIGRFVIDYALRHLDKPQMRLVEEFLELTPEKIEEYPDLAKRKLKVGMRLTNIALGSTLEPVQEEYRKAKQKRVLRADAPPSAWQMVKQILAGHEPDYFDTLEQRLARFA